jgi:SNF2-related domain
VSPFSSQQCDEFCVLEGSSSEIERLFSSDSRRFVISYDLAVRQAAVLAAFMVRHPVHLVLDEAHRMKAGLASQRGAFLLGVATLQFRRDILTGTPMPQGPNDLAARIEFLWPGQGFDLQITRREPPRDVCKNLFARTTKNELGLPPAKRHYIQVGMAPDHLSASPNVKLYPN